MYSAVSEMGKILTKSIAFSYTLYAVILDLQLWIRDVSLTYKTWRHD